MNRLPGSLKSASARSCVLDYLKSVIIVAVVFLHTILAYPTWGRFNPTDYVNSTAPIIDPTTSSAFDLFPALLNNFFMALLFFISGLFVWKSIAKKGATLFLKDRWRRLGIPFVLSLVTIMPIAYYPSFLQTGAEINPLSYWCDWSWISGPAWFLSMLLAFNVLAALVYFVAGPSNRTVPAVLATRPVAFFFALIIVSGLGFMPLMAVYGPFAWLKWGPIMIGQACRLLLYAVYFFAGVAVGARGVETTFLSQPGPLARRWWVWLIASTITGAALVVALGGFKIDPTMPWTRPAGWWLPGFCVVIYSASASMAVLALFLRFVHVRHPWADSLSNNSYAIYLVHYPVVIWLQYALLGSSMPATTKALVVFGLSLGLSWGMSVLLRRIPGVRAVL